MDLRLSPTQEQMRQSVRELLASRSQRRDLTTLEADPNGYDPTVWRDLVEQGWLGLPAEGDLVDLGIVLGEFGRAAVPSPYFQSVATVVVLSRLGLADHEITRSIMSGGTRAVLLPRDIPTHGSRLTAGPFFVEWAHVADVLVCPIVTPAGCEVAFLDRNVSGLEIEQSRSMDNERLGRITLRDTTSGDTAPATGGTDEARALGDLLRAAEIVGGIDRVVELTVEYMKQRHQFGKALGSFQAVQHLCADMLMHADAARLATFEALARADHGLPVGYHAAVACYVTGQYAEKVTTSAAELFGGVGYITEHSLHFYFRRAKAQQLRFGPPSRQLATIGRHLTSTPSGERLVEIATNSPRAVEVEA